MIGFVLDVIKAHLGAPERLRVKRHKTGKNQCCHFCQAQIPEGFVISSRMCRNCLTPVSKGLASTKWAKERSEHNSSQLAKLDKVKYARSSGYAGRRFTCPTLQKLSLKSRLG